MYNNATVTRIFPIQGFFVVAINHTLLYQVCQSELYFYKYKSYTWDPPTTRHLYYQYFTFICMDGPKTHGYGEDGLLVEFLVLFLCVQ